MMTFDIRAWGERHKTEEVMPWQLLGIGRTSFYKYCAAGSLPKWLVLACERLDDEWMPIETAPKKGEIWTFNGEQGVMQWSEGEHTPTDKWALWCWADENLSDIDPAPVQPTHWRPLPQKPATGAPKSQEK